jgi:hypothetical protein
MSIPDPGAARFRNRCSIPRPILWASLAIGCLTLLTPPEARAQDIFDRDQSLNVLTRPHPEYDPLGVRAGAFIVHPDITMGVTASDDIRPAGATPMADIILPVAPHVAVNSDWGRHAVNLDAGGTFTRYASHPELDSDQYTVSGLGRLNASRDLTLTAQASQARILLPTSSDAYLANIHSALLYDETRGAVGAAWQSGRIKLAFNGAFEDYAYLDGRTASGVAVNEHFRDRETYIGDFRADYAISPDWAVFVEETLTRSNYSRSTRRNETTAETLIGPNFQISHLITAELGVGYLSGWFTDPGASTISTLHGRERIAYYATPLITVTFNGSEGLIDSGIPTSPAYFNKNFALEADYELLRNLIFTASETANWNDYQDIDRHDNYYKTRITTKYLLNRGFDLELSFDHLLRQSRGDDQGKAFDENVLSIAFRLKR